MLVTANQVADTLRLLVPGFVMMKTFRCQRGRVRLIHQFALERNQVRQAQWYRRVAMSVGERVVALAAVLTAGGALGTGCSPSATTSSSPSARVSAAPTAPCDRFTAGTTRLVVAAFLDAY